MDVERWCHLLWKIGPPILLALKITSRVAPYIVVAVESAERSRDLRGADKKRHALEFFRSMTTEAREISGEHVADPAAEHDAVSDAIDRLVQTVNLWTRQPIGG